MKGRPSKCNRSLAASSKATTATAFLNEVHNIHRHPADRRFGNHRLLRILTKRWTATSKKNLQGWWLLFETIEKHKSNTLQNLTKRANECDMVILIAIKQESNTLLFQTYRLKRTDDRHISKFPRFCYIKAAEILLINWVIPDDAHESACRSFMIYMHDEIVSVHLEGKHRFVVAFTEFQRSSTSYIPRS